MSVRHRLCLVAPLVLLLGADRPKPAEVAPGSAARNVLLSGIRGIAAPGAPGPLCVFGPKSYPVVLGKYGKDQQAAVVAAGEWGKGRVVAFGHTGYLDAKTLDDADTARLLVNAIGWSAGRARIARQPVKVATVRQPKLAALLAGQSIDATDIDSSKIESAAGSIDVFVLNTGDIKSQAIADALLEHVKRGHGLILASLGWGWKQLNPGKSLIDDHPGNRLLAPLGIAWADGTLDRTNATGYSVGEPVPPLVHGNTALQAALEHDRGKKRLETAQAKQASATVVMALRSLPIDQNTVFAPIRRWATEHADELVPSAKKPVGVGDIMKRLAITMQLVAGERLSADQVQAYPAADAFPGSVPADAPRIRRNITVDTAIPGWHSTGLYAPPGSVIEVKMAGSPPSGNKPLAVRIGCHTDGVWHLDKWQRLPEIADRWPITTATTRVANPVGGLIYIDVPDRTAPNRWQFEISGAVAAPYYKLGVTTTADWQTERKQPGPWAELASDRVIITVPSTHIRDLADPQALMEVWNQVLDACADLAAIPRERRRPERYVADQQISAGYMHSGYPIMTHLDAAATMASREKLLAGNWGLFHEMGHNHQSGDWTFDGTGEVTCNLFSIYVSESVCKLNKPGHDAVKVGPARDARYRDYVAKGRGFEQWKSDPFLALTMYVQLRESFGWETYKKVFAEYRDLPASERPKGDADKRDQWLVRFSRATGRNLGPFFEAWGVPVSSAARAKVEGLPDWMPAGFPPR